jgi:flagellar basal-body rod protein FlgC
MDFFTAMDVLASGLGAERVRMNTSAANLANAQTTRTPEGGPYKRRDPVFTATAVAGGDPFAQELAGAIERVEVTGVVADQSPPRRVYDPGHPDAGPDGFVLMPNVQQVEEMVNMITATRAYESAVTALDAVVQMAERTLNLGK